VTIRIVPITMSEFSVSEPVFETALDERSALTGQYGVAAVHAVNWLEKRGRTVTSISERWKLVAPNIWLDMSKKK